MRDMLKTQEHMDLCLDQRDEELCQLRSQSQTNGAQLAALSLQVQELVRGTAWYSLATRGLVWGGGVGGGVGRMVSCESHSNC